jgi:hypothetical protein
MKSKLYEIMILDNIKGSTQQITRISKDNFNRLRQNSIDEGQFQCFEGYHQIINDISKNKRLLMNRRQREKPSINMLKSDQSIEQKYSNETPTA